MLVLVLKFSHELCFVLFHTGALSATLLHNSTKLTPETVNTFQNLLLTAQNVGPKIFQSEVRRIADASRVQGEAQGLETLAGYYVHT